ncbi:hypothetical protein JCM10512_1604 [Bacteroides reticulotermitis JCM 10512]|uniref:Uncharacterized protein n=2 Tax=Bacteroides reticulotermitis TaxID=1133319 RepID=W4URS6_9BACE|nr:hypothetical protein JCM10512_1604 [Bacteroides reticulotermitis JCM 10512]
MDIIKRNFIEDVYDVYNNVKKAAKSMSSTSPEKDYEIKYNYLLKCYKETYGDIYDESIRSIDTRVLSNYEEAKKFFECSIGKYWF